MSRGRMDTMSLADVNALGEDDRKAVMEMVRDGEMDLGEVSLCQGNTVLCARSLSVVGGCASVARARQGVDRVAGVHGRQRC